MSETRDYGAGLGGWVASIARTRGVDLGAAEAEQVAALVAPTLEAFAVIAEQLAADDDAYEFRRLLGVEARRG